jgi:hypothetical protein
MNYRNAKFCSDQVRIDCEIEHKEYGWIPFTCDPNDNDPGYSFDVREFYNKMISDGQVSYMTQDEIDKEFSNKARYVRNRRLVKQVDPIVTNPLRWSELSSKKQQEWANYRRSLLDLPEQEGWPHNIDWPTPPNT